MKLPPNTPAFFIIGQNGNWRWIQDTSDSYIDAGKIARDWAARTPARKRVEYIVAAAVEGVAK